MINIFTKVLGGVSLILLIISLVGYSIILNKNSTITSLNNDIKSLQTEVSVLENRVNVCQQICKAEKDAKEYQQETIDDLRDKETKHLNTIDKLLSNPSPEQEETNEKITISDDSPLPPDLIRVLDNVCEGVRGQACTNP